MHHTLRTTIRTALVAAAIVMSVTIPTTSLSAQDARTLPAHAVTVTAGVSQFDLSGTGTDPVLGVRAEKAWRRWLVTEAAVSTFKPSEDLPNRTRYWIPEAQVQLQLPGARVRPYLGAGGGYVIIPDARPNRGTASLAAGVRAALPGSRLDTRGELRVRGIGRNFGGSAAEWTAGVGYRF